MPCVLHWCGFVTVSLSLSSFHCLTKVLFFTRCESAANHHLQYGIKSSEITTTIKKNAQNHLVTSTLAECLLLSPLRDHKHDIQHISIHEASKELYGFGLFSQWSRQANGLAI